MSDAPFTKEQISMLDQPLDPKRVKHRAGGSGMQLSYLKGHDVIDTANRIFGYGNWGYDLLGVELNTVSDASGEVVGGYYAARVRLTVAGCVPVTEEGVCPIQEGRNPRAKIDAHDMARKGAITDALKRSLRCYGDQFGNSLYDTDLVDGQPRDVSGNGRPKTGAPAPVAAVRNGAEPARPAAPRPVAQPAPAPLAQPAPAVRPVPANGPVPEVAPRPVRPAATVEADLATEQQRQGIRRLAVRQNLTEAELQSQLQKRYGHNLEQLNQEEARNFIQVLQQQGAA